MSKFDKQYYEMRDAATELKKKVWPKPFWYEVWIDFGEDFDELIWPKIEGLPKDAAARYCLDYMIKREQFYASPHYYEMLNRLVSSATFEPA